MVEGGALCVALDEGRVTVPCQGGELPGRVTVEGSFEDRPDTEVNVSSGQGVEDAEGGVPKAARLSWVGRAECVCHRFLDHVLGEQWESECADQVLGQRRFAGPGHAVDYDQGGPRLLDLEWLGPSCAIRDASWRGRE